MLAALRNEKGDPEEDTIERLDELHTTQTVGALLIGEAIFSLIDTRKAARSIEAMIKAAMKG